MYTYGYTSNGVGVHVCALIVNFSERKNTNIYYFFKLNTYRSLRCIYCVFGYLDAVARLTRRTVVCLTLFSDTVCSEKNNK